MNRHQYKYIRANRRFTCYRFSGVLSMSLKALIMIVHVTVAVQIVALVCAEEDKYSTNIGYRRIGCPPWYFLDNEGKCSFSDKLPQMVQQYKNTSELQMGICMTVTNSSQAIAQCPYLPVNTHNFSQYHSIHQVLPSQLDQVNNSLCAPFNRKGFLCSECKENYGLAAYHYYGLMCVKCSNSVWKWIGFILLLFTPPTLFFLVFLILNINFHSGRLTGFIFFSHTIITTTFFIPSLIILPQSLFGYWPLQILLALYGIWNLNFMQLMITPFCVSTSLSTLQLVSLGYVSSVYPLVLCIITYYLIEFHARGNWLLVKVWRPFRRFCISSKRSYLQQSVIRTLATFILLSYGKNVFVSFTLLQGFVVVELDIATNTLQSLPTHSVDLGVPYFSATHAPYAVLGLFGGVVTIILPLVLVLIYPTRVFPKLIGCCGLRRWHALRTFMEVFVGSYKDGTEGTKDYRLTAAVYLIGRIIVGLTWFRTGARRPSSNWLITAVPYILIAVAFALFKPHRNWWHNVVDVLLFLLIAKICIILHMAFETPNSEHSLHVMILVLLIDLAIPHVVLVVYCGFKIVSWTCSQDVKLLHTILGRNRNVLEDDAAVILPQIQESPNETQALLCNTSSN